MSDRDIEFLDLAIRELAQGENDAAIAFALVGILTRMVEDAENP